MDMRMATSRERQRERERIKRAGTMRALYECILMIFRAAPKTQRRKPRDNKRVMDIRSHYANSQIYGSDSSVATKWQMFA